jgi:hypothetical protein
VALGRVVLRPAALLAELEVHRLQLIGVVALDAGSGRSRGCQLHSVAVGDPFVVDAGDVHGLVRERAEGGSRGGQREVSTETGQATTARET